DASLKASPRSRFPIGTTWRVGCTDSSPRMDNKPNLQLEEGDRAVLNLNKLVWKLAPRGRCAEVKKDRLTRRHEVIDKAIEVGITEPEAILQYLKENYPSERTRKGRGFIDAQNMMKTYRAHRRRVSHRE